MDPGSYILRESLTQQGQLAISFRYIFTYCCSEECFQVRVVCFHGLLQERSRYQALDHQHCRRAVQVGAKSAIPLSGLLPYGGLCLCCHTHLILIGILPRLPHLVSIFEFFRIGLRHLASIQGSLLPWECVLIYTPLIGRMLR